MRQQRPERNFARRVTPLSAQRNRQQAKPCAPQISRLNCDLPKSTDPCEIDEDDKALQQVKEIKKYMIGASEFDILEKLIDLNAPKHVVEYQMRKVEEEEQGALIDTQVNSMVSSLENQATQEVTQIDETSQPQSIPQSTPRRNICLPSRRQSQDETAKLAHRRKVRRNLFPDEPSTSQPVRSNQSVPCPTSIQSDVIEEQQEEEEVLNQDLDSNQDETKLIEKLEELIDAEHADAQMIFSYTHKTDKKCDGITIQPELSFKHAVQKNITATVEKMMEKEEDVPPEVAAAMLHSEEKGAGLSNPPREIYESLFQKHYGKHVIEITSASKKKPEDVVPLPATITTPKQPPREEDAAHLDFLRPDGENKFSLPEANLQEESTEDEYDLLGFSDSQTEEAATFKVMLTSEGPFTASQVQMRGSQPPYWFPGYFVAMPDNEEIIAVEKPYTILEKAWQTFRPTKVKPRKGAIVIGKSERK
ncbi:uncharacterized protein isoform X2 [Rhodnius prolixus]|uniref:uncharacterized protein isoform X2 n=1 Tax=Rhodnius prolixus TaxID=13249 RepID=UPI003D18E82F